MRSRWISTILVLAATAGAVSAPNTASAQDAPRRPETQAVIDACRAKGRQADTAHTLGVFKAALEIMKIRSDFEEIKDADPLTVEIAVMLHDIGGGGLANAKPGAGIAREVLTSLEGTRRFPDGFIDKVSRIVETHHVTGAVRGKDDIPEWYIVLLADTPRIYRASPADGAAYAALLRARIAELKAALLAR